MHKYILGQSGTGKSTVLKNQILDRINDGDGIFFIDPHGHDTDELLQQIPKKRRKDVILFDPSREEILPFNPLSDIKNIPLSASITAEAMKEGFGYGGQVTPLMDMYLYMAIFALMEAGETLVGLPYLLSNATYRAKIIDGIKDDVVQSFWMSFSLMTAKDQRNEVSSTINKAFMLISDPRVRRSLIFKQSKFNASEVVANKIFFARLPQGQLSPGRVSILGSIILSLMHQAALDRDTSIPFHFILDECHLWAASVVKEMLSGIRKFNCTVTVAHQFIDQLDPAYYAAIIGNCAEQLVFRTSMDDSKRLEQRFGPNNHNIEFHKLPDFHARVFPFTSRSPDLHVKPRLQNIQTTSLSDILTNHRLNLTVSQDVADKALLEFRRGL